MELRLSNFNELTCEESMMVDGGGILGAVVIVGSCTVAGGAAGAMAGAAAGVTLGGGVAGGSSLWYSRLCCRMCNWLRCRNWCL